MQQQNQKSKSKKKNNLGWILPSFFSGFVIVGGFFAWLAYAEDSDIHQQSYAQERITADVLRLLDLSYPARASATAATAGIK